MRHGGGIIAIYNEEVVIKSLTDYKYSFFEAVNFANDGCLEVQIPGKTHFSYIPFDALAVLQKKTLQGYENTNITFDSFEELYKNFGTPDDVINSYFVWNANNNSYYNIHKLNIVSCVFLAIIAVLLLFSIVM